MKRAEPQGAQSGSDIMDPAERSLSHRRPLLAAICALGACAGLGACAPHDGDAPALGNSETGALVISRKACGSCHIIPGITGADGQVGPSLAGLGERHIIAGMLPNSRPNLEYYLLHPQEVVKGNYMPDQGLTARQARDAAAYLLELR